jgi:hypothetical protein
MRNKWFVVGILLPAALLTYGAVRGAMSDNALLFSIPPALLALALIGGAVWVARSASFAPAPKARWDYGTSDAVKRWNKHREDVAAAETAAPSSDESGKRKNRVALNAVRPRKN